ncbi:MAG: hypothetical protein ACREQ5_19630, partial [Candidatus Dormibacteria bacterium]
VYDGELTVPGGHSYGVTAGMNAGTEVLVLFDRLEMDGKSIMNYELRGRRLHLEAAFNARDFKGLVLAEQQKPSMKAVEKIWKAGGEGAMLKDPTSRYRPGYRSADWIKVKNAAAATLTIIGFRDGASGPCSVVRIRDDAGIETTVKNLNNASLRAMSRNPKAFIGKRLVISFQEKTPSGSYRHPMFDHLAGNGE